MSRYNPRSAKAARVRRARGIPGYTPTAPVAQHVHTLRAAGWTRIQIATAAHVAVSTIDNLLHRPRPAVLQRTAVAILAVKPTAPATAASCQWVAT